MSMLGELMKWELIRLEETYGLGILIFEADFLIVDLHWLWVMVCESQKLFSRKFYQLYNIEII